MNTQPAEGNTSTISTQETVRAYDAGRDEMNIPANARLQQGGENRRHCPQCNMEILPGYYFCQNCGSALLTQESSYQPTVRASGSFYPSGQETILPPPPSNTVSEAKDAEAKNGE